MKFPNLVDLGTRKETLNFESFYFNKDYYQEFLSAHGEVSVIIVEFFQYSNGWVVGNSWEDKRRCMHSIVSKKIITTRNLTVTKLLNLPDVRDILANVYALKACFYRFFNLIKEHFMNDNVLKQFILIFTDGAPTNVYIVEEHSHLMPLSCIIHELELVIKESIAKGLLNYIKECLINSD